MFVPFHEILKGFIVALSEFPATVVQNSALAAAVWIVLSYLVGSVPFGLVAGFLKGVDIRAKGSGNIGATNAIRILGKPIGLAVFVLDFLKGFGPAMLVLHAASIPAPDPFLGESAGGGRLLLALCCGGAAVVGHCFSPYLRFRGGKGVAAAAGVILAVRWDAALISFAVFFLTRKLTRFVSLSSIALGISFPLAVVVLHWSRAFGDFFWLTVGGSAVALLIILRHSSNIIRIIHGEEDRVGEPDPDKLQSSS